MEIIQIVAIGLLSSILALMLKKQSPESSMYISIAAGVIIFFMIISKVSVVVDLLKDIGSKINLDTIYIGTILKIIGIAYISEFGVQICKDAGESAIASKIEFSGKVLIMVISAPILMALMDLIIKMLP
jgi:stage III sporulation protein AD